jgi:uncharacterized protein (DUF1697 family)
MLEPNMPVVIAMFRALNVGGNNMVRMEDLRALHESLELSNPQTYVQSGNVVFATKERNILKLAKRIEDEFEKKFGFRSDAILRTAAEMEDVIARNPFAGRDGLDPKKLAVTFLAADPGEEARVKVRSLQVEPEELWIDGRELYVYFPNGQGKTKFPAAAISKLLKTPGTARNWNSVTKLLELARLKS